MKLIIRLIVLSMVSIISLYGLENAEWEKQIVDYQETLYSKNEKDRLGAIDKYMATDDDLRNIYTTHSDIAIGCQTEWRSKITSFVKMTNGSKVNSPRIAKVIFTDVRKDVDAYGKELRYVRNDAPIYVVDVTYADGKNRKLGVFIIIKGTPKEFIGFGCVQTNPNVKD